MYYIAFGILYGISLLPFAVLYLLADFLYVVTYYLVGYRKTIVFKNLRTAFPEKTNDEIKRIAKDFYHHFWDNWIEAVKLLSISEQALHKRFTGNLAALQEVQRSGKSCHILLGHQFNWEWGNAFVTLNGPYTLLAAYSPISNKVFDRLFLYLRRRFGSVLIPFNDMRRGMLPYRHTQYALALMADQSPSNPSKSYWLPFFNSPTAFLQGPEKGARLGNMPVVYVSLSKTRRGHYHLDTSLLTENAGQTTEGELTGKYVQALETNVRKNPSLYLWSHKRWKHGWKDDYQKNWMGDFRQKKASAVTLNK